MRKSHDQWYVHDFRKYLFNKYLLNSIPVLCLTNKRAKVYFIYLKCYYALEPFISMQTAIFVTSTKIFFPSKVKVFKTSIHLFVCTCKRDICHKLSSHMSIVAVILMWCFLETQPCCLPACKNPLFYFLTCFQTLFVISTNCFSATKQKWTYYACSDFFFFLRCWVLITSWLSGAPFWVFAIGPCGQRYFVKHSHVDRINRGGEISV